MVIQLGPCFDNISTIVAHPKQYCFALWGRTATKVRDNENCHKIAFIPKS